MINKIDWSKAPSDATHVSLYYTGDVALWYSHVTTNSFHYTADGVDWHIEKHAPTLTLYPRPIIKREQDLTKLDTAFGELDRATQLRLVEHVLDGGKCESKTYFSEWVMLTGVYRIQVGGGCFHAGQKYRAIAKQPTEIEQLESQSASLLEQMTQLNDKIKTLKGGV